jgi:Putative beta-barrel porin 2
VTAMVLLFLAASDPEIEVRAVRLTPVSSRLALRVLTSVPLPAPEVRRAGEEVVVSLGESSADAATLPPLEPPVEELRFERSGGGLALHVRVPPEVPFEVVQEDTLLTVFLGEEQADELRMRSARELYGQLFPVPLEGSAAPPPTTEDFTGEGSPDGWRVGRLSVKPGLTASYVDADTLTGDAPEPVRDRYLQIGPSVELATPVGDGTVRASYEPRFRLFSSIPEVGTTTHVVNSGLDLPLGTRVALQGNYHFSHGVLETREVDPGQEYFFDLGRFTRNDVWGTLAIDLGPRMIATVGAGWNDVDFSGSDQFFPYQETTVQAGFSYELGTDMKGTFEYVHHRVPPPDERPLVESTGDDLLVGVDGQIAPLLRGRIEVGYRHWSSPEAAAPGRSYSGLLAAVALQRQFAENSFLDLRAGRTTNLSAYLDNAFYVSTAVDGAVSTPIPLGLTARGALGYQWNTYEVQDASIGEPREDTIFGWAIGLGRILGPRTYVRADYRRDRRRSNITGYDVTTDGFIVQLGIGFAPSGVRR